jgi:hypothetical protein
MTHQEAKKKAFTVKWQIGTCSQGEECWCRTISPEEPITFKSGEIEEEYYIIGSGEINKETAEYIVKLHNQTIKL